MNLYFLFNDVFILVVYMFVYLYVIVTPNWTEQSDRDTYLAWRYFCKRELKCVMVDWRFIILLKFPPIKLQTAVKVAVKLIVRVKIALYIFTSHVKTVPVYDFKLVWVILTEPSSLREQVYENKEGKPIFSPFSCPSARFPRSLRFQVR